MATAPQFDPLTVQQAVRAYLRQVKRATDSGTLSPATQKNYQRDLAEFTELAGSERVLDELTAEDIDDILLAYAARPDGRYKNRAKPGSSDGSPGRGPGAQSRFRASICRLFSYALRQGFIHQDPMPDTVIRPKARNLRQASRTALGAQSAHALLDAPAHVEIRARRDQQLSLRDTAILRILLEVGPRVSELCSLNQADMEERDGAHWLIIRQGKGGKRRDVPLSPGTHDAIVTYLTSPRPEPPAGDTEHRRANAAMAMFRTFRGRRIQPRDVQNLVHRACQALPAQVRREVTPHGLRHTAATLLLSSGAADVKTVQALLGHESLATTGIYLDEVSHEMVRAVAAHPVTGQ